MQLWTVENASVLHPQRDPRFKDFNINNIISPIISFNQIFSEFYVSKF